MAIPFNRYVRSLRTYFQVLGVRGPLQWLLYRFGRRLQSFPPKFLKIHPRALLQPIQMRRGNRGRRHSSPEDSDDRRLGTNFEESGKQNAPSDVLFFIAISPTKVGGIELFTQHLAMALESRGCRITFCFSTPPNEVVQSLLNRPNTRLLHLRDQASFSLAASGELWRVLKRVRASTVVYSFGGILRPLPWICTLAGVDRVIYNDHASRVPDDDSGSTVKRMAARVITYPVKSVVAVSNLVASSSRRDAHAEYRR